MSNAETVQMTSIQVKNSMRYAPLLNFDKIASPVEESLLDNYRQISYNYYVVNILSSHFGDVMG